MKLCPLIAFALLTACGSAPGPATADDGTGGGPGTGGIAATGGAGGAGGAATGGLGGAAGAGGRTSPIGTACDASTETYSPCAPGSYCLGATNGAVGRCSADLLLGESCNAAVRGCATGLTCYANRCTAPCTGDAECGAGERCAEMYTTQFGNLTETKRPPRGCLTPCDPRTGGYCKPQGGEWQCTYYVGARIMSADFVPPQGLNPCTLPEGGFLCSAMSAISAAGYCQ